MLGCLIRVMMDVSEDLSGLVMLNLVRLIQLLDDRPVERRYSAVYWIDTYYRRHVDTAHTIHGLALIRWISI